MHEGMQGLCYVMRSCVFDTNRIFFCMKECKDFVLWCESYVFSKIKDNLIQPSNSLKSLKFNNFDLHYMSKCHKTKSMHPPRRELSNGTKNASRRLMGFLDLSVSIKQNKQSYKQPYLTPKGPRPFFCPKNTKNCHFCSKE